MGSGRDVQEIKLAGHCDGFNTQSDGEERTVVGPQVLAD